MKKIYLSTLLLLSLFILISCTPNRYDDYYIVVFYTNKEQTNISIDTIEVEKNSKITEPKLNLDGKTIIFDGWYKDIEYKEPFNFEEDIIDKSMTIYVKWIFPEFKVVYMLEDGEENHKDNLEVFIESDLGTNGIRVREAKKEGYRFRGWYLNDYYPESQIKVDFITLNLYEENSDQIKLYPRWEKLN